MIASPLAPYTFGVKLVTVHDGDTLTVDLDLGMSMWHHGMVIRLLGLNARELDELGGTQARDNLAAVLLRTPPSLVTTVKPDKYGGRWLGHMILSDGTDLSAFLIATDWAAAWNGKGAKPLPPWPRSQDVRTV